MFRTKPTRADIAVAAVLVLLAAILFWHPWQKSGNADTLLLITPEGSREYSLENDREIEIVSRGITLRVVIENGTAYVAESDCPDGTCVHSSPIRKSGQTIVCAPAGVSLHLKGGDTDDDFLAG